MRILLVATGLLLALVGCNRPAWRGSVVLAAATQHQCTANHVAILGDDGNVTARVVLLDVCGTRRTYRSTVQDPRDAFDRPGWVEVTQDERSEISDRVHREPSANGTDFRLWAEMVVDGTSVRWLAIPARDADHVAITVVAPEPLPAGGCAARAMIDGAVTELAPSGTPTGGAADRTVFASAPLSFVRQLASSQRAAMRVCTTEVQIGDEERAVLTELVARIDEELRWAAQPSTAP